MRVAWLAVVLTVAGVARGGEPEELSPGDHVTITVGVAEAKRARRIYGAGAFITVECVADLAHFKELDASMTAHLHPVDLTKSRLRSGAPMVIVPDRTPGAVLEVRQPDGVTNDTIAVRVRVDAGPLEGRELWARRRWLVPRGTTRAARERRERRKAAAHPGSSSTR